MDRSKFANILITTRLLPHFTSENIEMMKSCIFEQFRCANESQFLCKILENMHKSLSNESTKIIKNKAIEIADQQEMIINSQNTNNYHNHVTAQPVKISKDTNTTSIPNTKAVTVYNYIQDKYNDQLSILNSDTIDQIGSFLTKRESIEFGYLNKQLYIETQKLSYLLKRCNDYSKESPMVVNNNALNKMI